MKTKYQLAFLGSPNSLIPTILKALYVHVTELGISEEMIAVIDTGNFGSDYRPNAPVFCLYFGEPGFNFKDLALLDQLINDAGLILPVVPDLTRFKASIPPQIQKINGLQLNSAEGIEALVSCILEGFGLLRTARKLFISYKRDESSIEAMQLFEEFERHGFDVFLDTHSVRPSEPFQEELWHRMADAEIVVLLDTPGFLNSHWTKEELARANSMQIGILQIIWPSHTLANIATLSIPFQLTVNDFGNAKFTQAERYLNDATISRLVDQVEYLRARSLAARQDNIVAEFVSAAKKQNVPIVLFPENIIVARKGDDKEFLIIPTVGVPQALNYHKSEEIGAKMAAKPETIYLLYDHINIRDRWLEHLHWLDKFLPIKGIKVIDSEKWLQGI